MLNKELKTKIYSHASPVEEVCLLVVVVVGVVIVLPRVFLHVDVVLVNVVAHVDACKNVLQFGVVVVRNWSEWVEKVGVYFLFLDHSVPLSLLCGFNTGVIPGEQDVAGEEGSSWVES
jgi:hypothetical protein